MPQLKKPVKTKSVCAQIESLRHKMGYSIGEMAAILGMEKPTYQGYESGRRVAPYGLIEQMKHHLDIARQHSKEMPRRVDAAIKKHHPHGVISDALDGWD